MAEVFRICAACGQNTPLEAQFCPHCGHDTQAGLPMRQSSALPVVVGKAALPMLVTAGTVAARLLWKLLRSRALPQVAATLQTRTTQQPLAPQPPQPPQEAAPRTRRSVHIRSTWAVGDANGNWRKGYTEHQIDFED